MKITVYGDPVGKERPRFFNGHNRTQTYTPKNTKEYENKVKEACASYEKLIGACDIDITAYFRIPKSTTKRERMLIQTGQLFPCKKPDIDNIIKIILDGLNGVMFDDDKQVVNVSATKVYTEQEPKVEIQIFNHLIK